MKISELKNQIELAKKANDTDKIESLEAELYGIESLEESIKAAHPELQIQEYALTEIQGLSAWILSITFPGKINKQSRELILHNIIDADGYSGWASSIQPDDHTLLVTYIIG